jgi:CRISPR type III-B/RAMP module RAMP protein Cmr6
MEFSNTGNNSWLYQKAYFHGFEWRDKDKEPYAPGFFTQRTDWLKATSHIAVANESVNTTIRLKTVYPGLVTGIGTKHESTSRGELKLGFEFDYALGMPIIRGHGLKGALRSAFPQDHRKNVKYKKEKAYQIHCWLSNTEATVEGFTSFDGDTNLYKKIVAIEQEIFDGKLNSKLLSNYKQDVFFDSYISEVSKHDDTINQYLGTDSITPHAKKGITYEASMLTNPVPFAIFKGTSRYCF